MTPAELTDIVRLPEERELGACVLELHRAGHVPRSRGLSADDHTLLRSDAVQLRESAAPTLFAALEQAKRALGYTGAVELFVRAEKGDAYGLAVQAHVHPPYPSDPVACIAYGPRTIRLPTVREHASLLGHELGHLIAGHVESTRSSYYDYAGRLAESGEHRRLGLRTRLACEMTADRLGLVASRDLHAAVRLEMTAITGVDSHELPVDPPAFLEQARQLVERSSTWLPGHTHPWAAVRCHALALFARSARYARATGASAFELSDAELDAAIAAILDRIDPERTPTEKDARVPRDAPLLTSHRLEDAAAEAERRVLTALEGLDDRIEAATGGIAELASDAIDLARESWESIPIAGAAERVRRLAGRALGRPAPEPDDEVSLDPYKEDLLRRFEELERRSPKR